jgi:hypothetical protein
LDRASQTYYPGDFISGYVFLQVTSNEQVRSVKLRLTGAEHTMIVESRSTTDSEGNSKSENVEVSDTAIFLDVSLVLYGSINGNSRYPLIAGQKYAFPFSFQLPYHCLPSCYLDDHAYIIYQFHAEVDRPWAFDYNAYLEPKILNRVGCSNPGDLVPREVQKDHEIC